MSGSEYVRRRASRPTGSLPSGPGTGLPRDLVAKAGQRLGVAALVYAGVYLLAYGAGRLGQDFSQYWGYESPVYPSDAIAGGFIAFSVAMFLVARSGRIEPTRLLDLGLVYEVIAAAGIDVHLVWGFWSESAELAGISWVCVWIVFFPLIVPSTPGKTFVAAISAASMTPLLYAIGVARGGPPFETGMLITYIFANYICVGIAVIGSRMVYRMGADISKARRMGSYHLVELLGEGGMGEVWKAEHKMLARPAAIKLVRSEAADTSPGRTPGSPLHRFEREVQATAQLRSPHTVEVYDYGLTEDGTFYYVMELLDGLSLEELVKQYGPVPAERVIHILRQACHSLHEAHARGLVHRDIKPANLFLCRYGEDDDFLKVLDFGLVKRAEGRGRAEVKLTEAGAFAGTPAYGSPEGAMGEREDVDGRSDLYSLGCVAFWMLTGRPVFQGATPMVVLVQHVKDPPPRPSTCTELPIPPALDALILELLQKDKAARPRSAGVLEARLAAIDQVSPWTAERARQWWDRHHPRAAETQRVPAPHGDVGGAVVPIGRD